MKIAFDNQIFLLQKHGGISRYFCNLIKNLKNDPRLEISLPIHHHDNEHLKEIENILGIKNHPKKIFDFFNKDRNLNREVSKNFFESGNFDILHATYYDGNLLNMINKKPLVITIHDMIYEIFPEFFSLKDQTSQLKRHLLQRADKIIVVSENTKKDLLQLTQVDEEKIEVIPLSSSFTIKNSPLPKHKSNEKYLLYVGNRSIYKNFYFMINSVIELLRDYDDLKIICFGAQFDKKEKIFLKNLGIEKKVTAITGGDDQLIKLYQNATAFIFPSYYEGFGIPTLEAFSCGCPVLASNSSSIPEVAGDAAIYFDPKNNIEIRNAVEKILNDPTLRQDLINKGYERNELFSWEKSAKKTQEVYNSIYK